MNTARLQQNPKTSQNGSQQVSWQNQPPHPSQPSQQQQPQQQQRGSQQQGPQTPLSQPQLSQNYIQQSQQQQSQQQSQQQHQGYQYTSANYTLPGVINYLTSEFTNLERFKIMTNLEKSEMKYKIIQLQCEVNSLKLVSDKQRTRIEALEKENAQLKQNGVVSDQKPESAQSISTPVDIPDIDLSVVKKSRHQLTKSMKEIVHLLKIPSAKNMNYLAIPDANDVSLANELDALVNHNDNFDSDFNFNEQNILSYSNSPKIKKKPHNANSNSLASQYFDTGEVDEVGDALEADLGQDPFVDYKDLKSLDFFNDKEFTGSQVSDNKQNQSHSNKIIDESDAETEILDHEDLPVIAPLDQQPFAAETNDHVSDFEKIFHDRGNTVNVLSNSPDEFRVEVYSEKAGTKIFTKDVVLSTISIDKVINLFVLKVSEDKGSFVVVQNDGLVFDLVIDSTSVTENDLITHSSQKPRLESAGLIEIDSKEKNQKYGLVLNTIYSSSADTSFLVKVFQITALESKIISKEIGSFNKNFFGKDHNFERFSFVDWSVNKKAKATPRSTQSTPKSKNKGRNTHSASSNDESLLAPYELKFSADDTALTLNVVNKTITYEA